MQYSLDCALQQSLPAGSYRDFLPQMMLSCIRARGRPLRGYPERVSSPRRTPYTAPVSSMDDLEILRAWLLELTEQVAQRLRRHGLRGRTVNLKVRFADFQTITRSKTLDEPTASTDVLWEIASELLTTRLPADRQPVRLLGMGVSDIDGSGQTQGQLFDQEQRERETRLDRTGDSIRDRFGADALRRASAIEHEVQHRPQPRPDSRDD